MRETGSLTGLTGPAGERAPPSWSEATRALSVFEERSSGRPVVGTRFGSPRPRPAAWMAT